MNQARRHRVSSGLHCVHPAIFPSHSSTWPGARYHVRQWRVFRGCGVLVCPYRKEVICRWHLALAGEMLHVTRIVEFMQHRKWSDYKLQIVRDVLNMSLYVLALRVNEGTLNITECKELQLDTTKYKLYVYLYIGIYLIDHFAYNFYTSCNSNHLL